MADSADQLQLKTQKCTNIACELTNIPYQSKNHRGSMNKNIPHTTPRKHISWPASGYD